MKLSNTNYAETNKIRVKIKEIKGDTILCTHLASGHKTEAYIKPDMNLEIGQIVLLEYRRKGSVGGYIVADTLMEVIYANVLEAQHLISNGLMYTSIIMENTSTKQRIHSVVPSSDKLFGNTNIVITGDKVKLYINNGNIFKLEVCSSSEG